jgi:hypothetical protein
LLLEIQRKLKAEDRSMAEFGFPTPPDMSTELEQEKVKYDPIEEARLYEELNHAFPDTEEHAVIHRYFKDLLNSGSGGFMLIDGPGGIDKSTLLRKFSALTRSKDKDNICKVCCSITLGATLYPVATSAHTLFKYPVVEEHNKDVEELVECLLHNTERLELLLSSRVIIWDEFYSKHRELFEAVLRVLDRFVSLLIL